MGAACVVPACPVCIALARALTQVGTATVRDDLLEELDDA